MGTGLFELAIVILIATVLGVIARLFKQPLILAFIFTGIIISYFGAFHLNNKDVLNTFSDLGIMFLLFLVGLEIDFSSLKMIGKPSIIIGAAQIIISFILGFIISHLLHFTYLQSAYISIALTLSSTVIVVKLLSEKKDLNSLYGKISIGVLLLQDMVAVLLLVFLSGLKSGQGIVPGNLIIALAKGIVIFALILFIGRKILPLIFDRIAYSQELLFLSSLAWCFLLAAIVSSPRIGFPIEISGLLAGLALANSAENHQISTKIKYLRDFFVLIFFVILGSSLSLSSISKLIGPIIILSLFVLIGTPLIMLIVMGLMGYRKKTSFLTGITLAQVSEFGLVLAASGLELGHITGDVAALITAVAIITISISTYMIVFSHEIYEKIPKMLISIFERKNLKEKYSSEEEIYKPIILIGSHRLGQSIAYNIPRKNILIIDFDPQVIRELQLHDYAYLFGDVNDEDIFSMAHFEHAKLIISTVADIKDNLRLLQRLHELKRHGAEFKIIMRSDDEKEVKLLYEHGADYVIFPHFTSGQYLGKSIAIDPEMKIIETLRNWDFKIFRRLEHGSYHSRTEKEMIV